MKDGRIVEQGPTAAMLDAPADAYTRQLLADAPGARRRSAFRRPRPPLYLRDAGAAAAENPFAIVAPDSSKDVSLGRGPRAVPRRRRRVVPGARAAPRTRSWASPDRARRPPRASSRGSSRPTPGAIELDGTDVTTLAGAALRDVPAPRAARLPEPVRLAGSPADGRRDRRRAAAQLRRRRPRARAERGAPSCSTGRAARRRSLQRATARAVGRAAAARRDRPRARRSTPRWSCSTRRSPRSTSPSRRRSSSCSIELQARARPHLPVHLARPRRGAADRHTVSVMRRGRIVETGADRGGLPRPAAPLHPRAARRRPRRTEAHRMTAASASSPGCSTTRRRPSATASPPSRSGTPSGSAFDRAWVAQHHFHAAEGGLPVAAGVPRPRRGRRPARIRLGTGIITLPLEDPVRVAEDAVVLDLLSGGRAGAGRRQRRHAVVVPRLRPATSRGRGQVYAEKLRRAASTPGRGGPRRAATGSTRRRRGCSARIWQATFSAAAAPGRAGRARADAVAHPAAPRGRIRTATLARDPAARSSTPTSRPCRGRRPADHGLAHRCSSPTAAPRRCASPRSACAARPRGSAGRANRRPATPRRADRRVRHPRRHAEEVVESLAARPPRSRG